MRTVSVLVYMPRNSSLAPNEHGSVANLVGSDSTLTSRNAGTAKVFPLPLRVTPLLSSPGGTLLTTKDSKPVISAPAVVHM